MNQNLKELVEVSQAYGKDKTFVIAGGGNTSFKDNDHISVKASGVALETIDEHGFVCLSRAKLKIVSSKTYNPDSTQREAEVKADLANAIVSEGKNRPSVETSMHEIIDYQFVVHTHPTKVNAVMCSNNAESVCRELFGDQSLFIPYTDPGYVLFKKVETEIALFTAKFGKAPQIIFLENHGVFVAANSVSEIDDLYSSIIKKIDLKISEALPADDSKAIESVIIDKIQELHPGFKTFVAKGIESTLIRNYAKDQNSFLKVNTAFTPDDIVYCKAYYLFIPAQVNEQKLVVSAKELIDSYYQSYGYLPKVLMLEGKESSLLRTV